MKKADELRQERFKLAQQMKAVIIEADKREEGKRDLTAEERTKYDAVEKDFDKLTKDLEDVERREKLDKVTETFEKKPEGKRIIEDLDDPESQLNKRDTPQYRKAYRHYLGAVESDAEARGKLREEIRALQMDVDTAGGFTVVPQMFVAELIEAIKAQTVVRALCRQFTVTNAESLGAPSLDNRPADPTWTSEILTGSEDSTMSFGKRELHPYPLAQRIKISKKLVRASALNIDAVVRDQLAYKAAVVEENNFLNGTGAQSPLGVFTATPAGIDTSRDISTGNTTTEIRADGLIEAKYALRPPYWNRSKWIFHQSAVKQIRKLRGNDGDFLWKAGLASDRGDTLLDCPMLISEYAPSTFTTGAYVGILGAWDYYWIADALDMTIQVLTELYAETNQNGYIARKETDGLPILAEAFARVTLA